MAYQGGKFVFRRFGRSYHLRIETADDLRRVPELDEALWIAGGAPIKSFNCDETFLKLIDTDNNDRIMCYELKDAIRWIFSVLKDVRGITNKSDILLLDAINIEDEEGAKIHRAAEKIIERIGSYDERGTISLEQVRKLKASIENASVSEIGVVLPQSADDERIRQFITDIIAITGGTKHPSGAMGITQSQLDDFIARAKRWLEWNEQGKIPDGTTNTSIMPLGSETPIAYGIFSHLRNKVDEYFMQCELIAVNPQAEQKLIPDISTLGQTDITNPDTIANFIKQAPIAKPNREEKLNLQADINPYYRKEFILFVDKVVKPILGDVSEISADDWEKVKTTFADYENWLNSKPDQSVSSLGEDKLREYLTPGYYQQVSNLITERKETAFVLDNIRLTEKAILYQAYLIDFANNFVGFPYLYDAKKHAMFEMGTVIMDGRKFTFAIKVEDINQHSKIVGLSNMFVMYLEVFTREADEKYYIAVPVTSGDKGNISVGKRGIFRDVNGREFDTRVIRIVENPISIREALLSPFQRLGRIITGKIEAITSSAEKKLDSAAEKLTSTFETASKPSAAQRQSSGLITGGVLMGGGVAIAAIGTAATYIIKTLVSIGPCKLVLGLIGIILIVAVPISILAIIKLRRRDLSVVLEGAGWAINSRMRLTLRQGKFFTQRPSYPKGSKGVYRVRKVITGVLIIIFILLIGVKYYVSYYQHRQLTVTTNKAPTSSPTSGK